MKLRALNHAPHKRFVYASGSVPRQSQEAPPQLVAILPNGETVPAFVRPGGSANLLVEVPVTLEANSETDIEFLAGEHVFRPFLTSEAVLHWLAGIPFAVKVDGEIVQLKGEELVSESTPFRKVFRYFGFRPEPAEEGADVACEMICSLWSRHDVVDFDLQVTVGTREENRSNSLMPEVTLEVYRAGVRVNHEAFKCARPRKVDGATTTITLLGGVGNIGDAQGAKLSGAILCPGGLDELSQSTLLAESVLPVITVASGWATSGRYGALGHVVPPPAWVRDPERSAVEVAVESYRRGPFFTPFAWFDHEQSLENPGGTGRQPGLGVSIAHDIAATGRPERILALHRDVEQEACRPTTFVNRAGEHFSAKAHPQAYLWQDRPFWRDDSNKSPDSLGRSFELPDWDCARSQRGVGWGGYDRQHYSPNALAFHTLLTGDLWSRRRLRQQVERWIAAHRVDSDNVTVDGFEASRAVGRAMLFAAHAAVTLDDLELRARMIQAGIARWTMILAHYAGRYGQNFDQLEVQPLDVLEPDSPPVNHQSDLYRHWNPWQEAMIPAAAEAWRGILEGHELAPRLKEFAWRIARTITLYGFHIAPEGWVMGVSGVEWFNGRPPEANELRIGDNFDPYSGYTPWQMQAALLAELWAQQRGDTKVQLQANFILRETLGRTIGDPLDPNEWRHDILNHIAVVQNPWERLPLTIPEEAKTMSVGPIPVAQRIGFAAAVSVLRYNP